MAACIETICKAWQQRRRSIFRFHRGFSSETDSDVKCKQTSVGQVSEMELIIGGSQGASQRYKTTDLQKTQISGCDI
jgi:hypothetical protein